MSFERKVEQIVLVPDPKDQTSKFCGLIDEVVAGGSSIVENLMTIANKILSDNVQQQVTKNVILHFAKSVSSSLSGEILYETACHLITAIKQNVSSYDEADFILREALFGYYLECEQFSDAAQILCGVNLESTTRVFTDKEKADIYVRCAETYLEDDEAIDAETFVNKASGVMNSVDDWALQLRYRVTYARVMDANRKFLDAAVRYYELSTNTNENIVQDDLLELLGKSVTCAILGKAGQQRTRVLGLLFHDERLSALDQLTGYSSHGTVLMKMFKEQILKKEELAVFEASLMPHQKATTSDGFTIPEKAVIEHNMAATGRIYDNIRFAELGNILLLDVNRVEKMAATMITENRLKASIDQTEGILIFEEDTNPLQSWDDGINEICTHINECSDTIQQTYSELILA